MTQMNSELEKLRNIQKRKATLGEMHRLGFQRKDDEMTTVLLNKELEGSPVGKMMKDLMGKTTKNIPKL